MNMLGVRITLVAGPTGPAAWPTRSGTGGGSMPSLATSPVVTGRTVSS